MPRMTRARAAAIAEDVTSPVQDEAAGVPLPSTPRAESNLESMSLMTSRTPQHEPPPAQSAQQNPVRRPLGEISLNGEDETQMMHSQQNHPAPTPAFHMLEVDLTKPKRKKRRSDSNKENEGGRPVIVVEDDRPSSASSAVDEAREELKSSSPQKEAPHFILKDRPTTPPSKAARVAARRLSPKAQSPKGRAPSSHTPRFDPSRHNTPMPRIPLNEVDDSFVDRIETRSPSKVVGLDLYGEVPASNAKVVDVFLDEPPGHHTPTSGVNPDRTFSREQSPIEKSIEALDAMEDAIDEVGQALPVLGEDVRSPVKGQTAVTAIAPGPVSSIRVKKGRQDVATSKPSTKKASTVSSLKVPVSPAAAPIAQRANSRFTPTQPMHVGAPRPAAESATKPATTIANLASTAKLVGRKPSNVAKEAGAESRTMSSTTAASMSVMLVHRPKPRISSLGKPFQPTKSVKAPTTSTFSLPGDALSAKFKAQREERLKRKQENAPIGAQQKRQFKARPVPRSVSLGGRMSTVGTSNENENCTISCDMVKRAPTVRENIASRHRLSLARGGTAEIVKSGKQAGNYSAIQSKAVSAKPKARNTSAAPAASTISCTTPTSGAGSAREPVASSVSTKTGVSIGTRSSIALASSSKKAGASPGLYPTARTTTGSIRGKPSTLSAGANHSAAASRKSSMPPSLRQQQAELREKQEAVRKARAEASERGRAASKAWAEKKSCGVVLAAEKRETSKEGENKV